MQHDRCSRQGSAPSLLIPVSSTGLRSVDPQIWVSLATFLNYKIINREKKKKKTRAPVPYLAHCKVWKVKCDLFIVPGTTKNLLVSIEYSQ